MKKKIFTAFVFMATIFAGTTLLAQENAKPDLKVKTKSNIKNDKVTIVKINSTEKGCRILVGNEIESPRDAASGLPTGKRMHKPFVITKELDVSSSTNISTEVTIPKVGSGTESGNRVAGEPIGGIIVKGGRNPGGSQFNKIVVEEGEFTLPRDCPDGDYTMTLSWSWGASNSGSAKRCEKSFTLIMENGACKAINKAGLK